MVSGPEPTGSRGDSAGGSNSFVGRVIGDFEIVGEVGRGGMGIVYEARQKSLNRFVALKVLTPGMGMSGNAIVRFQREAQAAANLSHPNIVPIFAQGQVDDVYFYAMELIRGESVYQIVKRARGDGVSGDGTGSGSTATITATIPDSGSRVSPASFRGSKATTLVLTSTAQRAALNDTHFRTVASHIADVADALAYAHEQGVLHRDIKPHNLLMDRSGRVKVSDFGLARLMAEPGVTVTGEMVGSPLYMSPEQLSGGRMPVDGRTDIYSLGTTLYEWLTLQPPYPGDTRESVIAQILSSELQPPRLLVPQLPVDLETICLKALARDPSDRYASAADMRDDLRRYVGGQEIKARRTSLGTRIGRQIRGNPITVAVGVFSIVALAALSLELWRSKTELAAVTEPATTVARPNLPTESGISQPGGESQSETGKIDTVGDPPDTTPTITAQQPLTGEEEMAADGDQPASNFEQGKMLSAAIALGMETLPGAGSLMSIAAGPDSETRDLARKIGARILSTLSAPEATGTQASLFLAAKALADSDESDKLQTSLESINTLLSENAETPNLQAMALKAAILCRLYRFEEMASLAEEIIKRHPTLSAGYALRAAGLAFSGKTASALESIDQAVQRSDAAPWMLTMRAWLHMRRKNFGDAIEDLNSVIDANPDDALALMTRATIRKQFDEYESAIEDLNAVIKKDQSDAQAYLLRGEMLEQLKRYDEAVADYMKVYGMTGQLYYYITKVVPTQKMAEEAAGERRKEGGEGAGDSLDAVSPTMAPIQSLPGA